MATTTTTPTAPRDADETRTTQPHDDADRLPPWEVIDCLRYWSDDESFARSLGDDEGEHIEAGYCGIDGALDAGLLRHTGRTDRYVVTQKGRELLAAVDAEEIRQADERRRLDREARINHARFSHFKARW